MVTERGTGNTGEHANGAGTGGSPLTRLRARGHKVAAYGDESGEGEETKNRAMQLQQPERPN